jgi:hypothetical protein
MTAPLVLPPDVDAVLPYRGECGFCGAHDARHRVLDAIKERWRAGEPIGSIADDYTYPATVIVAIVNHWNVRRMVWS